MKSVILDLVALLWVLIWTVIFCVSYLAGRAQARRERKAQDEFNQMMRDSGLYNPRDR